MGLCLRSDKIVGKVQLRVALAREGLYLSNIITRAYFDKWRLDSRKKLVPSYFVSLLIWQTRISYLKLVDENFVTSIYYIM